VRTGRSGLFVPGAHPSPEAGALRNVDFVQAGIEKLPLPDGSVDVVISNGVFNLCPDKPAVLAEVFQVLRPGGPLQMADILLHDGATPKEVAHKGEWSN
jgi:arsenite methyltransferase